MEKELIKKIGVFGIKQLVKFSQMCWIGFDLKFAEVQEFNEKVPNFW